MTVYKEETSPPGRGIADLLPWYAAGTLDTAETARIDQALAHDPDLRRQLDIVREELDETVFSHQAEAGASPRVLEALFAAIDREPARSQTIRAGLFDLGLFDLGGRLAAWLQPRTLAWAGIAAALVIAVQAGFLFDLTRQEGGATYETASKIETAPAGTVLMIGFMPEASAAEIEALLQPLGATIVDGPRNGLYRLRLGTNGLAQADIDRVLATLRAKTGIVRFAAMGR